jgi:hypothetical protein
MAVRRNCCGPRFSFPAQYTVGGNNQIKADELKAEQRHYESTAIPFRP